MKIITIISSLLLVSCSGVETPIMVPGIPTTMEYRAIPSYTKSCDAEVLINGEAISSWDYRIDCDYDGRGYVTVFYVKFVRYVSPGIATLRYDPWY